MRFRSSLVGRVSCHACAPLAAVMMLMACSSSENAGPVRPSDDGGSAEAAVSSEASSEDAGDDGGELEPPPYDFAVTCSVSPCVTSIAARGGMHACAVLQDGAVRCWGANATGQLGTVGGSAASISGYAGSPVAVLGVSSATSVAATGEGTSGTTCVVSASGTVTCFGSDAWGQLGRVAGGSPESSPEPAPVEGVQAKSVTLTNTFALAIGTDGRLWSWGTNDTYQLAQTTQDAGSGSEASRADRVSSAVRSCAGTSKTGFVVAEDGALLSWGGGTTEQLGRPTSLARDSVPTVIPLWDVSSVVAGNAHACALRRGRVLCWGDNERGQLGTGRKAAEWTPALAAIPSGVYAVALAAGGSNTCIIAANGDLYCWGANGSGQLATSSGQDLTMPTRIEGLGAQSVALGVMDDAICALLRSGSVACWGDNRVGQLGRGGRDAELHPQPSPVVF